MEIELKGAGRARIFTEGGALAHAPNVWAQTIFNSNVEKGWWDQFPDRSSRFEIAMGLIITEFAEAIEGVRKDLMDDHLAHHKMMHVEVADAAIRAYDMAGGLAEHWGVDETLDPRKIEAGAQHFINRYAEAHPIAQLRMCCTPACNFTISAACNGIIANCVAMARIHDFDLFGIAEEKIAYNDRRQDHTREARAAAGGKKY